MYECNNGGIGGQSSRSAVVATQLPGAAVRTKGNDQVQGRRWSRSVRVRSGTALWAAWTHAITSLLKVLSVSDSFISARGLKRVAAAPHVNTSYLRHVRDCCIRRCTITLLTTLELLECDHLEDAGLSCITGLRRSCEHYTFSVAMKSHMWG